MFIGAKWEKNTEKQIEKKNHPTTIILPLKSPLMFWYIASHSSFLYIYIQFVFH